MNLRPGPCCRRKLRSLVRHLRTLLAAAFGAAPPGGPGQCAGAWPCHLWRWQVPYAARPASATYLRQVPVVVRNVTLPIMTGLVRVSFRQPAS
jgi:hypothetical protein